MLRHSDVVTPAQAGAQSWMAYAFVYIVTNKRYGTLYVGVTSDLVKRASQHRLAILDGFTKDHGLDRLVWYEAHDDVVAAIEREKRIKRWRRDWKVNLVQSMNPAWIDLYPSLVWRNRVPAFAGMTSHQLGPGLRRDDMK